MKPLHKIILILIALALTPAKLLACAVCYANGANINDPMTSGMNWAILTLGVVVATVLGAFLTFLIHVIRKSEALEAAAQQQARAGLSRTPARPGSETETREENRPPGAAGYDLHLGSPEPSQL